MENMEIARASFQRPTALAGYILAACALMALSGCAHRTERADINVELPIPSQWVAGERAPGSVHERWWQGFGQPQLNDLIDAALRESYDLKAAAARIDAARAQTRIVNAGGLPRAQASLSRSREKQAFIGFPTPARPSDVLATTFDAARAGVEISWEIDLWGRVRAGKLAAAAELDAAMIEQRGARLSLAAQVAQAWFATIEAHRQLALARTAADNFRDTERGVRRRYEAGLRPSLDLRLAMSNTASAEATVAQRRAQRDGAQRQLEILIGRYPAARIEIVDDLPALPAEPPAGLPAEILARRPDLAAAERRVLAAVARGDEARAGLYPRLTLTASGGYASNSLRDVLRGDFPVWSVLGNVLQPIWEGGRLRATVDLNDALAREAGAAFAGRVLQALAEVEIALSAAEHLARRAAELAIAVNQAVAAQDLAQERYLSGLADIIVVLEAQRRAIEAQSLLIQVRREQLQNRIDLHLALGGGFEQEADLSSGERS